MNNLINELELRLIKVQNNVKKLIYSKDENDNYKYVDFIKLIDYEKSDKDNIIYKPYLKNIDELMKNDDFFLFHFLYKREGLEITHIIESFENSEIITEIINFNIFDVLINRKNLEDELKVPEKKYKYKYISLLTRFNWECSVNLKSYNLYLEYIEDEVYQFFKENIHLAADENNIIEFSDNVEMRLFFNNFKDFLINLNPSHTRIINNKLKMQTIINIIKEYTRIING